MRLEIKRRGNSNSPTENTEPKGGYEMEVSTIPWHVFLEACNETNTSALDEWLRRWSFADNGVMPSVEPAQ